MTSTFEASTAKYSLAAPGGLEAHDLQLGAEVIFAVRAGIALPAGDLRLEHDLLPDFEALDRAADLDNLAGDFVALRYGVFGIRVFAVVDVDIRAADAEAHHFDQNLIVADLGDGHVAEFNYTRGCHNFLQHYSRSFSAETFGWIGLINSDFIDPCFFAAIGGKDHGRGRCRRGCRRRRRHCGAGGWP